MKQTTGFKLHTIIERILFAGIKRQESGLTLGTKVTYNEITLKIIRRK